MQIWHPEVHQVFRESLYYYLCAVQRPFISEHFAESVKKFLKEEGLTGCCYYELFGAFDILFRFWLPAGFEIGFRDKLVKKVGVLKANTFSVDSIPKYWYRDSKLNAFNSKALELLNSESIRSIYRGKESNGIIKLYKESGLIEEFERSQHIKFFITISTSSSKDSSVEERIQRHVEETFEMHLSNKILKPSLYIGFGFAWAIIKAEVAPENFFFISDFIFDLSKKLSDFGVFPQTFISTKDDTFETDGINDVSLNLARGWDIGVAGIVPELYDSSLNIPLELKDSIQQWVRHNVNPGSLSEEERNIIHKCLEGIVLQEEDLIYKTLQDFFWKMERFLRKNRDSFTRQRVGEDKIKEVFEKAKIPSKDMSKFFSLGELLKIYAKTIEMNPKDEPLSKNLIGGWDKIANLRNKTVHGELKPLANWEKVLNLLTNYFDKIRLLREVIEKELVNL